MMLAMRMKEDALLLSEAEARELGEKIAEVQKHYPTAILDPKYAAIAALVVTVFKIEGPRVAAIALKERAKKNGPVS